mmetsp:Transcript_38645/g.61932  ORF Transcript_38645/g.61932 Transcript_38645/m.61932 type:complete len:206 (+) Transcript_38645:118-735(+)
MLRKPGAREAFREPDRLPGLRLRRGFHARPLEGARGEDNEGKSLARGPRRRRRPCRRCALRAAGPRQRRVRRPRTAEGGPAEADDAHLRGRRDGHDQSRGGGVCAARVQHRVARRGAEHRQSAVHSGCHRQRHGRHQAHQADQQAGQGAQSGERHQQDVRRAGPHAHQGGGPGPSRAQRGDRTIQDLPRLCRGRELHHPHHGNHW